LGAADRTLWNDHSLNQIEKVPTWQRLIHEGERQSLMRFAFDYELSIPENGVDAFEHGLWVPNIRFGNIDGEGRRGLGVM
jgi:hypothetical protein